MMAISTFGEILSWIRNRLNQVERNMSTNSHFDRNAIGRISHAKSAIDELIQQDSALKGEYIKAAESEYAALVELIQRHPDPLTDKTIASVEQLSHKMGDASGVIKKEKNLMKRIKENQ